MSEYFDEDPKPGVTLLEVQAARALDELSVEEVHDLLRRVADGSATPEERARVARWGHAAASIVHSVRNIIRNNVGLVEDTLRQICWFVGLDDLPPGTVMSAPTSDETVARLLEHFGHDAGPDGAAESVEPGN